MAYAMKTWNFKNLRRFGADMVERIEDTCIRIRSEMNEWMDGLHFHCERRRCCESRESSAGSMG